MLIVGDNAYCIGPADVPGGSGPPKIPENRQIWSPETTIYRNSKKQWFAPRFSTMFGLNLGPEKALKSSHFEAFWSSGAAFLGCARYPLQSGPERKHCSREPYNLAKPIVKPIENQMRPEDSLYKTKYALNETNKSNENQRKPMKNTENQCKTKEKQWKTKDFFEKPSQNHGKTKNKNK